LQTSALPLGYRAEINAGLASTAGLLFAPYRAALAEVNCGVCRRAAVSEAVSAAGITGNKICDGYWRE
jgi:hypothetical protein